MIRTTFKITGDIEDFARVDNLYKVMKREGDKLMKKWELEIDVTFIEKEGEQPPA